MSVLPDVRREHHLIEEVQRDVCRAFPGLPVVQVSEVVESIWAEYDDARVRDFIPLLVSRQARDVLRDRLHALAPSTAMAPST